MEVGKELLITEYLKLLGGEDKKIVIYGAGENGIVLAKVMHRMGLDIAYFCDRDIRKAGTKMEGTLCIGYEQLNEMKESVVVFVSPSEAAPIYAQLEQDAFPYVIPKKIMELIHFLPEHNSVLFRLGHFYSLYPDLEDIRTRKQHIFDHKKEVLDVDMNEDEQCNLLRRMGALYETLPDWPYEGAHEESPYRYYYGNASLSPGDTIALHCMLRLIKPKRIVEVGSGFTSAVTLDTNEYYLDHSMQCFFIEPYPALLQSLCKPDDQIQLRSCRLQEVEVEFFEQLESGDILFIDSTHVSKVDSDVNYLFFEILPRLKSGVYIHLHDIFYPFEYPEKWIFDTGMIWNELYLLRAFLQNNHDYSIEFFHHFMEQKHMELFLEKWPLKEKPHGGSLWMRKK